MKNKQDKEQKEFQGQQELKKTVIETYQTKDKDTGSSGVQIALLTEDIRHLQQHFTTHAKDHHSRRGLREKIEKRRKLMRYMKDKTPNAYKTLIGKLGIRG